MGVKNKYTFEKRQKELAKKKKKEEKIQRRLEKKNRIEDDLPADLDETEQEELKTQKRINMTDKINNQKGYSKKELMKIIKKIDRDRHQYQIKKSTQNTNSVDNCS